MGGYIFVFDRFEQSSDNRQEVKIEEQAYLESELVEVKLAVRLPYQVNTNGFEEYAGEIEMNGMHYNYVKRKVQNDTLVILCLPNDVKTEVSNARETFFSLVNDLNNAPEGKQSPAPVKHVKLVNPDLFYIATTQLEFINPLENTAISSSKNEGTLSSYIEGSIKPPELAA
jgi:hypothetical protein